MTYGIIPSSTPHTLAEIFEIPSMDKLLDSKKIDFSRPPYVRVGNLFLTTLISGPTSWEYIANEICPKDNIVLLAGRHGNIINPVDSHGKLSTDEEATPSGDAADPDEDRKIAKNFIKPNRTINVVDVRTDAYRTSIGMQSEIKKLLPHQVVILSWCYGLFTMRTSSTVKHGQDISNPKDPEFANFQKTINMKICDIVNQDWGWVTK